MMKTVHNKSSLLAALCILLACSVLPAYSQIKKIKKTIRAEGLLHRPISNKAFTTLFSGVFSGNLSMNWDFNHFTTGIFYNIMQSQIFPKFQSDPHSIQTVHTAGLRLGYDIYPSKTKMAATKGNFWVITPYLSGGFSQVDYSRLKCLIGSPAGKSVQTFSITQGWNFTIMFSEYDGVGFTIGYSYLNHEFNPDPLCLSQFYPDIPDADKKGPSQYILYGFNVHFDLARRERGDE